MHVEAVSLGEVRGFLNPPTLQDAALQEGVLTVSKVLYNNTQPYVTSVEATGDPQIDWGHYYAQSEQVASAVHLETQLDPDGVPIFSGGITVQLMPEVALPGDTLPTDKDLLQDVFMEMALTGEDGVSMVQKAATTTGMQAFVQRLAERLRAGTQSTQELEEAARAVVEEAEVGVLWEWAPFGCFSLARKRVVSRCL